MTSIGKRDSAATIVGTAEEAVGIAVELDISIVFASGSRLTTCEPDAFVSFQSLVGALHYASPAYRCQTLHEAHRLAMRPQRLLATQLRNRVE